MKYRYVHLCPEKIPLHPTKVNILWQKNSYDQSNLYHWFKDKSNHDKYDWYVFNSHWNYEHFRNHFDIPTHKSVVIKNGIDKIGKATALSKRSAYKNYSSKHTLARIVCIIRCYAVS